MVKVAKAKKSTHSKGKNTKILRQSGKQIPVVAKQVKENPHQQWEIDVSSILIILVIIQFIKEIGPIYLLWGKKRIKTKTGKPTKAYYIKADEKHSVWVKWRDAFADKPMIYWSAEPQGYKLKNNRQLIIHL